MTREEIWRFFEETGDIDYYLLYKEIEKIKGTDNIKTEIGKPEKEELRGVDPAE